MSEYSSAVDEYFDKLFKGNNISLYVDYITRNKVLYPKTRVHAMHASVLEIKDPSNKTNILRFRSSDGGGINNNGFIREVG